MIFLQIAILIFLCLTAVFFWGDRAMLLLQRLKRFHIGRWNNPEEWYNAVNRISRKWLKKTPVVSSTDDSGNRILTALSRKKKNAAIQSWQKAGLVFGFSGSVYDEDQIALAKAKSREISADGHWINPVKKVDFALLAYAFLLNEKRPDSVKPAMDWVIGMLEDNLCSDGMISYSKGKESNLRYVDTLGMACPFLALYGTVYNKPEYGKLAYEQISLFRDSAVLPDNQLPCHVFLSEERQPLGVYGWGRGTIWYVMALLGTYYAIPNGAMKEDLKLWIRQSADSYANYQKKDGGFFSLLQDEGQYDSSVTAGMAWFFRECADIFGIDEYINISDKCLSKLMSVTMKSGEIDVCQGDTHGIGAFSHVYDIMPFAQGLTTAALFVIRNGK